MLRSSARWRAIRCRRARPPRRQRGSPGCATRVAGRTLSCRAGLGCSASRRAVVNIVNEVHLAACGGRSASSCSCIVALVTRLSPNLALGRGHPVARWRGQHVGGGAAVAEVEVRAFCASAVVHERGICHRECASNVDTSTLPTIRTRNIPAGRWNSCRAENAEAATLQVKSKHVSAGLGLGLRRLEVVVMIVEAVVGELME
eukprot:scaffold25400_cov73-Phaeocystis_antarctica.AAC.4